MIFGFLAVKRIRNVTLILLKQCTCRNRGQWDALVSGPEQQVEFDFSLLDRIGIEFGQRGEVSAAVENSCVEKVRADAAGFKREFAELESTALQAIVDETGLVAVHK